MTSEKITLSQFADTLNQDIKKFLAEVLGQFHKELELLFKNAPWAQGCLFEYNERALVGLFNNAIVRQNKEYSTFEEYHVYERDEQLVGRADLLVMNDKFDLLIEVKKWVYDGIEYTDKEMDDFFKGPKKQLENYYNAEKSYFKKEQTFLSVLIFEYVAKEYLKEMKRQYNPNNETSKFEKGIDFDAFYVSENSGLMVSFHVYYCNTHYGN